MTSYEIEAASALGREYSDTTVWSKALVPLVAAALVVLLGLVVVGLTSDDESTEGLAPRPAAASVTPG